MNKQAATGTLMGLALGDALGRRTEFLEVPMITTYYGPWRGLTLPDDGKVTDDTQMTLSVARALRACQERGVAGPERFADLLREEFVDWYRSPENNRAPGRTCLTACALLMTPVPWQDASQIGSKGCGANMRVAPLGLLREYGEAAAGAAQLQAALTHGHPTGLAASDLTARAVWLLAQGVDPAGLVGQLRSYAYENRDRYHERWLGDLWTRSQDPDALHFVRRGWDECLAVLERLDAVQRTADPELDPCTYTGDGWIAEEALATGLLCFLLFPGEPLTALRRAACTRGDSDSIAALAGAFAGAHLGADAWPAEWTARIEHRDELLELGALWDA
ncbi:ADP-ribosylglycohydrolase family protein [Streptomyces sp. NRRL F-5727]|uniref:ADP-ribosylglycohydrolase family protein n=1 Tax=Streptomyces sp. NRRL F-5727 TaxID=1463871 RepID=UPI0004C88A3F|nr:ADP-ribosylglycohydrolase family protein [Streptomyces sp. NRRL F-5727]